MRSPETDGTQATQPEPSGCGQPAHRQRLDTGPAWHRAASRARLLSWLSLAYMTAEGAIAIVAAVLSGSVALLGFGLDSAIKGLASIIIWRFTGARTLSPTAEARALRAVAVTFFLLTPTSPTTPSPPCSPTTTPGPAGWVSASRSPH